MARNARTSLPLPVVAVRAAALVAEGAGEDEDEDAAARRVRDEAAVVPLALARKVVVQGVLLLAAARVCHAIIPNTNIAWYTQILLK